MYKILKASTLDQLEKSMNDYFQKGFVRDGELQCIVVGTDILRAATSHKNRFEFYQVMRKQN